jgi:hypothetical protein
MVATCETVSVEACGVYVFGDRAFQNSTITFLSTVYNIVIDVHKLGVSIVLQVAVALGWMLCIGCLTALVYGLYDTHLDRIPAAAYSSLSHTLWAVSLSWIVIACSTGYGG